MAKGLYIEGRAIKTFSDIVRNYNHEISFSNIQSFLGGGDSLDDELTLKARSFSLPSRGNELIESNFGGMKQYFPGKPTFGSTVQVKFEETESQKVQAFLYAWQQRMFNIRVGHSDYDAKRGGTSSNGICEQITITSFGVNGEPLSNKYFLHNAWLKDVEEVTIDYSQSEAITYNATFQFDFWTFGTEVGSFGEDSSDKTTVGTEGGSYSAAVEKNNKDNAIDAAISQATNPDF
jgi:hypothetical protein